LKIILSRKGFDSSAGGFPSPILPDGTLLSLPIPDPEDKIKYSDLIYRKTNYYDVMSQLNFQKLTLENSKIDLNENTMSHFDPDIRIDSMERSTKWKGLFGQIGAAQSHLQNQNVKAGDLFLFFGWFRKTILLDGKYKYDSKDKEGKHIIFGYLEIDKVNLIQDESDCEDWMLYHPHLKKKRIEDKQNTLYIAKENLSFSSNNNGYGVFNYNDSLVLTKEGESRSKWNLPKLFKSNKISYHTFNSWKKDYFQSTARGQEFVIEESIEVEKWAKQLILNNLKDDFT
jgi:Nucleotide modification associated domain 3